MMEYIETLTNKPDFVGTKLSSQSKTYVVKEADNYSYEDPIDKSKASKQVSTILQVGKRFIMHIYFMYFVLF